MKESKFTPKSGFTLIELLVVIAIMSTLAAIIFPKVSQYQAAQLLNQTALGFISVVRAAQASAISGSLCGATYSPTNRAGYWGFYGGPNNTKSFYYQPYCVDTTGIFKNAIPVNIYNYGKGVNVTKVEGLDNADNVLCSVPDTGTGMEVIGFDNISGTVEFLYVDNPDQYELDGKISQTENCQDSQTAGLMKMRYTLSSSNPSGTTYIFVDRGGSIYSSQTAIPTP